MKRYVYRYIYRDLCIGLEGKRDICVCHTKAPTRVFDPGVA